MFSPFSFRSVPYKNGAFLFELLLNESQAPFIPTVYNHIKWENDMDTNLGKENLKSDRTQLRKGKRIIYEGKEAEVISVKPLLTIKIKDRIICGSLQAGIEITKIERT